jgi:hypothetical protein
MHERVCRAVLQCCLQVEFGNRSAALVSMAPGARGMRDFQVTMLYCLSCCQHSCRPYPATLTNLHNFWCQSELPRAVGLDAQERESMRIACAQEAVRRQYTIHPDEELVVSFQSCEPPLLAADATAPLSGAHPIKPIDDAARNRAVVMFRRSQDMHVHGLTRSSSRFVKLHQVLRSHSDAWQLSALQGKGVRWALTVGRHTTLLCCLPR